MNKVNLVWITPDAEYLIAKLARVSNPANQDSKNISGLLKYMIKNQHWSPFEMASACFEINTTRDIGRQILRHRSFSFQEFSQRYAEVKGPGLSFRECRLQDTKNRQSSLPNTDEKLDEDWESFQFTVYETAKGFYDIALSKGIAKEQARALLPEGLTESKMYMSGTIRSWIHYCQLRCDTATQKEHRDIAVAISNELEIQLPTIWEAINAGHQ